MGVQSLIEDSLKVKNIYLIMTFLSWCALYIVNCIIVTWPYHLSKQIPSSLSWVNTLLHSSTLAIILTQLTKLITILLTNMQTLFKFYQLSQWYPFSDPEFSLELHITFSWHVFPLTKQSSSAFSQSFMPLTFLKNSGQLFCRMSLCLGLYKYPCD